MPNDEPRKARPFVLLWRSAVTNSDAAASVKLSLLGLAEFADADGTGACVSCTEVAKVTSLSDRTVRTALKSVVGTWLTRQAIKGQGQAWATYRYTLILPEGAVTVSARLRAAMRKGAEAIAGPLPEGAAVVAAGDRQPLPDLPPEGAAVVADEVGRAEEKRGKTTATATGSAGAIWGTGLSFLLTKSIREPQARRLLGKLRKSLGDDETARVLVQAEAQDVADPAAWLMACAARRRPTAPLPRDDRSDEDLAADAEAVASRYAANG